MIKEKDFRLELLNCTFKNVTYTIYNKVDDEFVVSRLNKKYDTVFSIDDFEYYDFDLTDKEKFLVRMYNSTFLKNIRKLVKEFEDVDEITIYINHEEGYIRVVKLKSFIFI